MVIRSDTPLSLDSTEKDLLLKQIARLEGQLQKIEASLDEAKSSLSKQEQSLQEWETIAGEGTISTCASDVREVIL